MYGCALFRGIFVPLSEPSHSGNCDWVKRGLYVTPQIAFCFDAVVRPTQPKGEHDATGQSTLILYSGVQRKFARAVPSISYLAKQRHPAVFCTVVQSDILWSVVPGFWRSTIAMITIAAGIGRHAESNSYYSKHALYRQKCFLRQGDPVKRDPGPPTLRVRCYSRTKSKNASSEHTERKRAPSLVVCCCSTTDEKRTFPN